MKADWKNRADKSPTRLATESGGWARGLALVVVIPAIVGAAEPFRIESVRPLPSRQLAFEYRAEPGDYYSLYGLDRMGQGGLPLAVQLGPSVQGLEEFRVTVPLAGQRYFYLGRMSRAQPQDLDGDGVDDVFELLRPRYFNALDPTDVPAFRAGTLAVSDRAMFEALAQRGDMPGMLGVRELKFLVAGVDTPYPVIYYMNAGNYPYHAQFAIVALGWKVTLWEFNDQTYFTDARRRNLAGSIVAYDHYQGTGQGEGLYTLEFWPADPVKFGHVKAAYDLVLETMPWVAGQMAYHPTGESQIELWRVERSAYAAAAIPVITTDELLGGLEYYPLILGETYGRLRLIDGIQPVSRRDIVVLRTLPSDLSLVSGMITETPQTPLSHVNLKARQNHIPNAYVRGATTHPDLVPWLGQYVRLTIRPDDFEVRAATAAEVEAFLESIRPTDPQSPPRDLSVTTIRDLETIGAEAASAVGAKAANMAELGKVLPAGMVPEGYAVPIYFYHAFMEQNGLYQAAQVMMATPAFQDDPSRRELDLANFRRRIRNEGLMPAGMMDELAAMQASFPPGTTPRCRSSSNNEDLPGFNGAGLYDSYTHHLDEGHIAKSIRQVWASLWNYRAFEEREFHRIDHLEAAMGVLVHPNFANERANGVGVTRNIYNPDWPGFHVNVQVGEDLVTNPQPNSVPDELVISRIGPGAAYEVQYLRHSSHLPAGDTVLSSAQVFELVTVMQSIHTHFRDHVYDARLDPDFAMEIEFKIDAEGALSVKQARPWAR